MVNALKITFFFRKVTYAHTLTHTRTLLHTHTHPDKHIQTQNEHTDTKRTYIHKNFSNWSKLRHAWDILTKTQRATLKVLTSRKNTLMHSSIPAYIFPGCGRCWIFEMGQIHSALNFENDRWYHKKPFLCSLLQKLLIRKIHWMQFSKSVLNRQNTGYCTYVEYTDIIQVHTKI